MVERGTRGYAIGGAEGESQRLLKEGDRVEVFECGDAPPHALQCDVRRLHAAHARGDQRCHVRVQRALPVAIPQFVAVEFDARTSSAEARSAVRRCRPTRCMPIGARGPRTLREAGREARRSSRPGPCPAGAGCRGIRTRRPRGPRVRARNGRSAGRRPTRMTSARQSVPATAACRSASRCPQDGPVRPSGGWLRFPQASSRRPTPGRRHR